MHLKSPPKEGLGAALNYGISKCYSEYVARMDSDDISCTGRFSAQLRVLKNPSLNHVSVVGTSSVLFTENSKVESEAIIDSRKGTLQSSCFSESLEVLRCSLPPSSSGFVSWSMLFSCTMIHPSVMFKKSRIIRRGGYSETLNATEDYDLWLRLAEDVGTLVSLPRIGLWHRKHQSRSNSDVKKIKQREESLALSTSMISNVLGEDVPSHIVKILKDPNCAQDAASMDTATCLLCKLENKFLGVESW